MEQPRLSAPGEVKRLLAQHGIQLKRRYGQNFLVDANILEQIVAAAELRADETVLEVGPGIGALTQALARRAGRVIAVEIDRQLVAVLRELFAEQPHVEIVCGDALELDWKRLVPAGERIKVVANLPYYITSSLLLHMLHAEVPVELAVVMIQAEVADRLVAEPGSKAYGSLTVAVQYRAEVEMVAKVPRTVFLPPPQVDSRVVRLRRRPFTPQAADEALFEAVVRAAFGQRRKTLRRALQPYMVQHGISSDALLERAGIDPARRGETLSVQEFVILADALHHMINW